MPKNKMRIWWGVKGVIPRGTLQQLNKLEIGDVANIVKDKKSQV